ncbi:uncharacterized protein LOC108089439 [Drosophila ficusphila]|uniref:uncharacterized protein LOC108089439 n=1 Tax=Drosophila ficusphila TaxID=30025 RepID=UPI0007E82ED2|nr:uncharacterized protein LOC108089439 [Drosophila ficusphila]
MMKGEIRKSSLYGCTVILVLVVLHLVNAVPSTTTKLPSTVATSTKSTRRVNPLTESKLEMNCKALCEHCGCLGFYCGEECLCECNDDNSDTECIRTMQMNAKTLSLPFEIVIQGPSSNRFVRNAEQFEQKRDLVTRSASSSGQSPRSRRSNITIYKPSKNSAWQPNANALEAVSKPSEQELTRNKRSVDHLEWFNDFAGSLVRPSPLGTRSQKQQRESKPSGFKRHIDLDEPAARDPWFLEPTVPRLIRPAPLKKDSYSRKTKKSPFSLKASKSKASKSKWRREQEQEMDIRPLRDALQVVERIPRVLQDTVSHLSSDPRTGEVFSLNIREKDLPRKKDREDEERAPRRPSDLFRDARRNEIIPEAVTLAAPMEIATRVPLPAQRGGFLFPWLRQRRLMRLQQARGNL